MRIRRRSRLYTHHVESLLDQVREGVIPVSPELIELVLKAKDHIKSLLNGEQSGAPIAPGLGETLIAAIGEFLHTGPPAKAEETPDPVPIAPVQQIEDQQPGVEEAWLIRFRPNPDLLTSGGNPVALLRELRTLGSCEIKASTGEVPALDSLQPDLCYLCWALVQTRDSGMMDGCRDSYRSSNCSKVGTSTKRSWFCAFAGISVSN